MRKQKQVEKIVDGQTVEVEEIDKGNVVVSVAIDLNQEQMERLKIML